MVEVESGDTLGDLVGKINEGAAANGMYITASFKTGEGIVVESTKAGSDYNIAITEEGLPTGKSLGFAAVDQKYIYDFEAAGGNSFPELLGAASATSSTPVSLGFALAVGSTIVVGFMSGGGTFSNAEAAIQTAISAQAGEVFSVTIDSVSGRVVIADADSTSNPAVGNLQFFVLSNIINSSSASTILWNAIKLGSRISAIGTAEVAPSNLVLDHGGWDIYGTDFLLSVTNQTTLQTYSYTGGSASINLDLSNVGIYDYYNSNNGVVLNVVVDESNVPSGTPAVIEINTGIMKLQIGSNEFQTMDISIADMQTTALGRNAVGEDPDGNTRVSQFTAGVTAIDVTTQTKAEDSIITLNEAIQEVSTERARLGAYQNRLEHTIANLGVAAENLTAAESRIRDADMAKEVMEFTKQQVLLQSANAMLAQANALPQNVLQLLR